MKSMKLVDFAKAIDMLTDDAFELARKADAAYLDGNVFMVDVEKVNEMNEILDEEIIEALKVIG